MTFQSGRDITSGSRVTVGLLIALVCGVFALWTRTMDEAKSDADWRARSEMHYEHCEQQLDALDARLTKIEQRMYAYESWPATSK